jgi:hypothetical protein
MTNSKRNPAKLYCEKCEKEIVEGQSMVEGAKGYYHFRCKHPALHKKMKTWRK